ncbi:hypothetical protein [Persephonella sp.]
MKILVFLLFLFFFFLLCLSFFGLGATLIMLLLGMEGVWKYSLYTFILLLYSLFGFLFFGELSEKL